MEGVCQGWVWKRKSAGSTSRFFSQYNKRFVTLDFTAQQFYYSDSPYSKKVSAPSPFLDLLRVSPLTRANEEKSLAGLLQKEAPAYHGVYVQTRKKDLELFFVSRVEADEWLQQLQRAIAIGAGEKPSRPQSSLSTQSTEAADLSRGSSPVEVERVQMADALAVASQVAEEVCAPPKPLAVPEAPPAMGEAPRAVTAGPEAQGGWAAAEPVAAPAPAEPASVYRDHGAGLSMDDRLAALEFSDYASSDGDEVDVAEALAMADALVAAPVAEAPVAALPAAPPVPAFSPEKPRAAPESPAPEVQPLQLPTEEPAGLLRESSWDNDEPAAGAVQQDVLLRESSWDD